MLTHINFNTTLEIIWKSFLLLSVINDGQNDHINHKGPFSRVTIWTSRLIFLSARTLVNHQNIRAKPKTLRKSDMIEIGRTLSTKHSIRIDVHNVIHNFALVGATFDKLNRWKVRVYNKVIMLIQITNVAQIILTMTFVKTTTFKWEEHN